MLTSSSVHLLVTVWANNGNCFSLHGNFVEQAKGQFAFILFEMGIFSFVTEKKKWFEVFEVFSEYLFWLKSHGNWYCVTCPIKAWSAWKWNYCSEVQSHPIWRRKVRTENSQRNTLEPDQDFFFFLVKWLKPLVFDAAAFFLSLSLILFLKLYISVNDTFSGNLQRCCDHNQQRYIR